MGGGDLAAPGQGGGERGVGRRLGVGGEGSLGGGGGASHGHGRVRGVDEG